jgi:hypothetical protein
VQSFKPRANGEGTNGGIGFVLPEGALPAAFGSNVRIGVTGGYVRADAKQTAFGHQPSSCADVVERLAVLWVRLRVLV